MARQVVDVDFIKEFLDALGRIAPRSQRQHLEVIAAEFGLQRGEHRHFLAAGRTPCRP